MKKSTNGYIGLTSYRQPPTQGGLLVIRHSERFPILSDEEAYTAELTENGKAMARELGMVLSATHHLGEVVSSPVYRCIQTGQEMIQGFANGSIPAVDIRSLPLLHFDLSLARVDELATLYLDDLTTQRLLMFPDSTAHLNLAEAMLANLPFPEKPGMVNIAVTHDTVVSFLYGHFSPSAQPVRLHYPGFLEGFYLTKENGTINLYS